MECPNCHKNSSKVIDSRPSDENRAIRRRRECENCGFRFTTFERIESTPLLVVKNDGTREAFDREKIMHGVMAAAQKRPVTSEEFEQIVDKVENRVRKQGVSEISSKKIGEFVMDELANVDDVAYIRFASIYREFKDMSNFMKTMEEIMRKREKSR
ncbi:MAG: transcriptional regulator NrdR [Lactobacillus sp.]|nr:transcriptional regulator NrdR [Lactobacillus sp.]